MTKWKPVRIGTGSALRTVAAGGKERERQKEEKSKRKPKVCMHSSTTVQCNAVQCSAAVCNAVQCTVFPPCARGVSEVFPLFSRCAPAVFPLCSRCVPNVFMLYSHCVPAVSPLRRREKREREKTSLFGQFWFH